MRVDSIRRRRSMSIVIIGALAANVAGIGYYAVFRQWMQATVANLQTIRLVARDYAVAIAIVVVVYEAFTWGLSSLSTRRRADAVHESSRRQAFIVVATSWLGAAIWAMALAVAKGANLIVVALAVAYWGFWGLVVGVPASLVIWWLAHRRNMRFIRHGGHRHDEDHTVPPVVR